MHHSEFSGPMEAALPASLQAVFMQADANGLYPRKLRLSESFHRTLCDAFGWGVIFNVFGTPVEIIPDAEGDYGGVSHLLAAGRSAPLSEGGVALWFDERDALTLPPLPPPPAADVPAPPPTPTPLVDRLAKVYPAPA